MTPHRRLLLALPLLAPALARAQDGAVSILVPYTPGTGQDVLARLVAPVLQGALGQPCVVENRAGASGIIGSQAVARATPDGRSLMLQANTFVMAPAMTRQASYDPVGGFTPIIHLTDGELVLVAHPSTNCETAAALVEWSRARQGGLDYASPGIGTPQHLAMELFRLEAGRPEMNHVPYRGSAPAVQDLLAGRIAAMMLPLHTALPLAADGRIRMLAVGSRVRSAAAAHVPTIAEAGFAAAEVDLWYGLLGPPGLPGPIVARLNTVLRAWLALPATAEALRAQGMTPARDTTPDGFAALIARDQARWAGVIARAGISAD